MNQSKCNNHKQAFTYYCESCDEPVCEKCINLGPHNYNLHRISQLQEAFKQRVDFIEQEVLQSLQPKRQEMTDQIYCIEYRIQEIKHMAMIIERDCRTEMNGILDRLNQSEGIKQAKLQHQIQIIQQDLEEINEIEKEYIEMNKDEDYFKFLAESKKFIEKIDLIIVKPFEKNISVVADDLPNELADLRIQLQRLDKQQELLNKLNEIIYQIMNEKKQEEDSLKDILKIESKKEIKEWAKLVDFFANQLKESQMVCYFCNAQLSPETINKKCKKNTKNEIIIGFTIEKPNDSQTGNERHFFGHSFEQKSYTLQQEQKKLPTAVMVEAIVSKIKLKVQENKLNLEKLFSDHDEDSNGFVNEIVFNYIMQEHLFLVDEEIETLIQFMDMKQEINYNVFMQMLRSNKAIQDKQQELLDKYKPIKTKKKN